MSENISREVDTELFFSLLDDALGAEDGQSNIARIGTGLGFLLATCYRGGMSNEKMVEIITTILTHIDDALGKPAADELSGGIKNYFELEMDARKT